MRRYGRSGWYGERHRHYLAAKGISTKRYFVKKLSERGMQEILRTNKPLFLIARSQDMHESTLNKRMNEEDVHRDLNYIKKNYPGNVKKLEEWRNLKRDEEISGEPRPKELERDVTVQNWVKDVLEKTAAGEEYYEVAVEKDREKSERMREKLEEERILQKSAYENTPGVPEFPLNNMDALRAQGYSEEDLLKFDEDKQKKQKEYEEYKRVRAGRKLSDQIEKEEQRKEYDQFRDAQRFERYWEGLQVENNIRKLEEERARKSIEEKGIIGEELLNEKVR